VSQGCAPDHHLYKLAQLKLEPDGEEKKGNPHLRKDEQDLSSTEVQAVENKACREVTYQGGESCSPADQTTNQGCQNYQGIQHGLFYCAPAQ